MRQAAISDEEIHLRKRARRRLVGAVAIVVFVVAVVPMVLDHEPQPQSHEVELRIPSMAEQPPAGQAAAGGVTAGQGLAPGPPPQPTGFPAEELLGEPAASASAAAGQGGYVIQLIATRFPDKARQLTVQMRENRIPAYTEPVQMPEGVRTRVRAGPFATEAQAQAARDRLRELNIMPPEADGKIVRQGQ